MRIITKITHIRIVFLGIIFVKVQKKATFVTDNEFMVNNTYTIQALKAGDQRSFEGLYRLYYKGLCAFGSQYVSLAEAEEIVQDTMMWIWENKDALNPDLSLKNLLFTMVKNKSLNLVTHQEVRRKVHQEIIDTFEEAFEDPDIYLNRELFQVYRAALAKLPPDFREAFELNRKNHLTHREIAERLNIAPQTVNYRICQALKILRTELKDYLPILLFLL